MSLTAAVWPQFATQVFRGGNGRLTCIGCYVNKQVTTFTFRAQATTCSKRHTRTVMDAGCECAPWVRSAHPSDFGINTSYHSDSWALICGLQTFFCTFLTFFCTFLTFLNVFFLIFIWTFITSMTLWTVSCLVAGRRHRMPRLSRRRVDNLHSCCVIHTLHSSVTATEPDHWQYISLSRPAHLQVSR